MTAIDLHAAPFGLDDEAVAWVEDTLASLTLEQKVGQTLCLYLLAQDVPAWIDWLNERGIEPGGAMITMRTPEASARDAALLQTAWGVPLLIPGNLESGTVNFLAGTEAFAHPMQVGATGDPENARRLAIHCARAGDAAGVNWAFAPVIDLSIETANPITNTRSFGRDPELVGALGAAYIRELEGRGIATSAKHFPGDGVDSRDQHLVTSCNDLDEAEWDAQYGHVYREAIAAGTRTIMVGHIRQRALSRALVPGIADRDILPASLAPELLQGVLRERLGFNGLIVTDNTGMAGFTTVMPRAQALPRALWAGNDMVLANLDQEGDYRAILAAAGTDALPLDRLDDAVRRVLATKASIGLHRTTDRSDADKPDPVEEGRWRDELAAASITVTKNTTGILPLAAAPGLRALVYVIGDRPTFYDPSPAFAPRFVDGLRARGLEVDVVQIPNAEATVPGAEKLHERYDVCLYFADQRFAGNTNGLRVQWSPPQGPDGPRHVATLPTVLVSIADPYLLQDLPMVRSAINGYTPTTSTVDAALAVLFGEAEARGVAPSDPFSGHWDAAL
ncbi:glycoside hydrolase family 3 protein [Microbacterium sp.]|uniref:glycoside hydrolase family 3 protein n=1 Tax=Microbacterium sp. TaxID=51671 RepID=UPI0039E342FF